VEEAAGVVGGEGDHHELEINDEIGSAGSEVQASMVGNDRIRACLPFIDGNVGSGRIEGQ
jgi:hypothetical protein